MNNTVFGETMENLRKHRHGQHVATNERRNYLVSKPNYQTKKIFPENSLAIEMKKKKKNNE